MEYETLEELLGFYYDQTANIEEVSDFILEKELWNSLITFLKIPEEAAIINLYSSE